MYQAIYDTTRLTLNGANMQAVTAGMRQWNFILENVTPSEVVYREGDRYVVFCLETDTLTVRLGMGTYDPQQCAMNSMRLHEMIGFLYGSLQRGCHALDESGLDACLDKAMKDLREFAHEFLGGDFRPFLRVLWIKKREELEAEKERRARGLYLA